MKAVTRLKTIVTDRGLLCRRSFQAVVTPIHSCQWRLRNYSIDVLAASKSSESLPTTSATPEKRGRGRPKRTPEEAAQAKLQLAANKAAREAAAAEERLRVENEAFKEQYKLMYGHEPPPTIMKPMRRPVGRPKRVPAAGEIPKPTRKRGVGRPRKRGRRPGSKNKPKNTKEPNNSSETEKIELAEDAGTQQKESIRPIGPRRKRRTAVETAAPPRKKGYESGRPRKHGPELPSQIIIDQGVKKKVYLRPGRARPFFSEKERREKEVRQAREELVKDVRSRRLAELAEYGLSEDGTKVRRLKPLDEGLAAKLMKKQLHMPSGPKAYEIGPLTRIARDFLANRKQEMEEAEAEWEYLLDEEGKPIVPKKNKGPGGDTRQKRHGKPKPSRWDGTVRHPGGGEEKWRSLTPKKAQTASPLISRLLEQGMPQPKPPTDKSLIMGEKKCTEIFEQFDFSEYQGCEIIDFNPGFGLFSRELNKAIRPSKHILLEHEAEFLPFLEHTCTDPSFEIVQKDLYSWETFDHLIEEKKISPKKVPPEEGVNKTFLVTGMLHKEVKGDRFMAQILDSMAKRDWIFKYGRVKFLVWADDEIVARYLPRSFGRRNRAAVMVEAYSDLREIATPPPFYTWADHRFFFRMDVWNRPGHIPNKQDTVTGVKYAKQLTYINMPREPAAVILQPEDYWPPLPWAQNTLLDFTPKLPIPYLRGDVPDSEPWKFFNLVLTSTFLSRHTTMRQVLSKIGEGAEQMFETEEALKQLPELPEKHAVHASVEELAILAQAYEFWPWRNDDPFLGTDLRLSRPGMLEELEDAQLVA